MFEARFQSFEDRAEPGASGPRVAALRTELARRGLTGWIVPHADPHQNEYVPASELRLSWLTGFTGSAGVAIVLIERARIRAEIAKLKADALVVSDPHAVAWSFNIRGSDLHHTPLPLSFAIVPM